MFLDNLKINFVWDFKVKTVVLLSNLWILIDHVTTKITISLILALLMFEIHKDAAIRVTYVSLDIHCFIDNLFLMALSENLIPCIFTEL